jgi:hypothetical protein
VASKEANLKASEQSSKEKNMAVSVFKNAGKNLLDGTKDSLKTLPEDGFSSTFVPPIVP